MYLSLAMGLLGLCYITQAVRSDSPLVGGMGGVLVILGTLKMVALHLGFPWLLLYCVAIALLTAIIPSAARRAIRT